MDVLRASVIIPTYNRAKLVRRAVESALRAVAYGDEVIVVDDGSTDGTEAALASMSGRIRFILQPHSGAGPARNRGISEAGGDLVAFLDSDDEWRPDHLHLHKAVHGARPDIAFSFSDLLGVDEKGNKFPRSLAQWHNDPRPWSDILSPAISISDISVYIGDMRLLEMKADYIPTFTMVAKRKILPDAAWFAEDVPTFEDLQCFGRLSLAGPAAFLEQETATQNGHAAARLTDAPELEKVRARIKILKRVWGMDAGFMAAHGNAYRERLNDQYLLLARCLLKSGRNREAGEAIRTAGLGSLISRFWSRLFT